jgi:hypothetical protein
MPTLVACPKCQRKLRVPDDLLGKSVKCPGCHEPFTADGGAAVTLALPPRETAEDERVTPEPGLGGDEKPEPKRPIPSANWRRVRRGFTVLLAATLTHIGAVLLWVGSSICIGAALFAGPRIIKAGGPNDAGERMMSGFVVVMALCVLANVAGYVLGIIGHSLALASPRAHRARSLAWATLLLCLVALVFIIVPYVLSGLTGGIAVMTADFANPLEDAEEAPAPPQWVSVISQTSNFINYAISLAESFVFGFYVRAIGFCLDARPLARSAKGWLIMMSFVAFVGLLVVGVYFLFKDAIDNARSGAAAAGPGGTGVLAFAGLACVFGVVGLALLAWYIILLAQARSAIASRGALR